MDKKTDKPELKDDAEMKASKDEGEKKADDKKMSGESCSSTEKSKKSDNCGCSDK